MKLKDFFWVNHVKCESKIDAVDQTFLMFPSEIALLAKENLKEPNQFSSAQYFPNQISCHC